MMFRALVLVFSLGILQSSAQILQDGQCDPNIALVSNFNLQQFLGTWYEVARAPYPNDGADCAYHQFVSDATTNALTYYHRGVNKNFLEEVSGSVVSDNTARLILNLTSGAAEFSILLTDYTSYAVGYRCENVDTTQRNVHLWQLGRTSTSTELVTALIGVQLANMFGINIAQLEQLDHSDQACYVLPRIEPNEPVILPGQCPTNMTIVQNFDVAAFTGVWHEIASYYSENALGDCPRAQYTLNNGVVGVINSQVINQTLFEISGNATVASTDGSATLQVILEVIPGVFAQQELLIIATDYTNYAISYTCQNIDNSTYRVFSWIVGRQRQLSANAQAAVDAVIDSIIELNQAYYSESNRSDEDCFYYPTPVTGQTVRFRGQCDMSIPAMPNFDPVRYMGLWHDIESYPSTFQQGTCNNAYYTLVGGLVDVYNTQVVNQTLDYINGYAVLASDDGSAKLLVTFPIAGTNFTTSLNYWVLDTDYETYSYVYTCENIDDDSRLVFSWKLSRTKVLTAAANIIINNITSTIPVLDERYFETKDQSVDGCFYYPEPQEGVPVVFPGDCEENIAVVNNFNLTQFLGTWHEIQAYPKEEQEGQCISHEYSSASATTLGLQSSSVVDQFLQLSTSTVSFSSTDGSAKLVITVTNSNGTQIQIPFWILSTDYTDYALAYSCVDLNSDFRGIWSWKLSRSRTLSAAANSAIDSVIATNVVLDNSYFETIDHSDDACFYLPDLAPGQSVVLPGQCNASVPVVQNFDAAAYQGLWHSIENYPSTFQDGTCNDATYTIQPDGTVLVFNTQVVNQTLDTIIGSAVVASTDGSAKLLVTFPNAPFPIEYWVLATDYTSYSLVYSCFNINSEQRQVWSWKLSRSKTLSENATIVINQVIDSVNVLNNRYYEVMDNSDTACFYYPEADGNPVIFRGQCNDSIPVVTNFDAVAYMGLWHDIQSYPSTFQGGSCNNAYYTLANGVVDVFNTQVVNQTLDTINGVAVLATNDGSAKLIVTFPIAGTNFTIDTPYWVLATDYTSYSLVYTCFNINADYRQVWSWKLSRSKQLAPAAATAINAVTSTIDVLDDRYYQDKDQSEEGCFYYPEAQEGVPVVFPGNCEENTTVVNNFNLAQFAGTWYEIEAYPKGEATGQCINHQYTQGTGNTLDLQSFSVSSSALSISNSTVSFSSTDGSAKLLISLTSSNGTAVTIPFWILSTDYTDYALAYSCVNLNDDFRGIYSWKLSRTKSLSTNANTVINNAISSIVVLDNTYYEPIDQSDNACFYLPDLAPGQSVVIPGQCNASVPVVQNFDAAAYQGLWHSIENYPSTFQDGTCNDATYTIQPDGTVLVFNTQVVNQTLDTIIGSAVVASTDGSAKLLVTFPNAPFPIEYWVLATDYTSYSLVYSCFNINSEQRQVWSWKLSRTKTLSENATNAINEVMDGINVLVQRYYVSMDNSDVACFYYPEADGNPVIFRGQCNDSIPVVNNFDAVAYMGLWHDIQSYPSTFQGGSCNNAFYTLVDGVVDVFNTQVVNQTLDTINGVAVLATNDGSAKLTVTFPIAGTNFTIDTPYWVLATDYTSYSLVYTCFNINADYRQVWSWKLSRSKQLAPAAATAINAVTSTIDVLDDRYYQDKDQSEEGCFYYPEAQEGVPVVFPGNCEENTTVVNNFNLAQFAGTWYEIEAYPKGEATGQCINHQYTQGTGNTLDLQSFSVSSSALSISNSTVSFSSTDGSAKLLISLTSSNGTAITIPFWILSTDYNDYALAYSCVNLNADYRGVYSWKLSRSKSLSTNAVNVINTAISTVTVLDNVYYEPISQTDDDCFYLPEIGPNEPVVFPGVCNATIQTVQNFDAQRFAGRWFDIESYFEENYGDCIDSTFTQNGNGFDVLITQVVGQTLDSKYSTATVSVDGSGKLTVTYNNNVTSEYWILATDYESYSLIYSCDNLSSDSRRVRSWKMSRTRQLPAAAVTAINNVVNEIDVLNDRFYIVRNHSDAACFYYPDYVPGQGTIFRGQCDENLSVVQNFDVARYLGLWYDIQSYPQEFQDGASCATATYTLGADGVDVYNTQVLNQLLDTINGTAVVASTDGSAKLLVTFPIAGTTFTVSTPYWVLATDYDSFSLVYSCSNVDSEHRRVTAWKLSRQQTLSAASATVINAIVNNVDVLDERYFEETGHTEADCFYYPDNNGGPVILDGQCPQDNEVNVVANFNAANFAGTWHEISRFPSELQTGECAANVLTSTGTSSLSLTQTFVYDERINSVVGTGVVSTDGRGILAVTLNGNEGTFNFNLYILDTDYTEFALAYGCVNRSNNTKQIYSWKLSRSRAGLSQAANDRTDQAVSNHTDLHPIYYDDTDQSDYGCFYYPQYDTLPALIELPGPCNSTIQAKANFDAAAYLGRWFEVSRFPDPNQMGTCSRAEYSLGNNVVDVYNTQVINSSLFVQTGFAVVSSVDGSGLLSVTFDVNGITFVADYYVLETDYTNFALVYSCRNTTDGNRQVTSWKLSRTPTLSNASLAVMDTFIASTQGLAEEYYTPTSQSDEDCFYVPEVDVNSAPVFRGACENITGVANFNVEQYVGWWHEIERYPTDETIGECISHQYEQSGNGFIVTETDVKGDAADVNSATVTISADGKLTKTYSDGRVQESWVLATDYQTYSLLYSCETFLGANDDVYRRVWSAKHSKSRQLTTAAQNAMNPVIEVNEVLYPQFYQQVAQDDSSCFHYPELTGSRVILPGRCDQNIPSAQNFDIDAYTGTWYLVELYPHPNITNLATCIGSRYSVSNDDEISVLSWVNFGGELVSFEGSAVQADSNGRLVVTTNFMNETFSAEIRILSTDYTSYSLVYTCENINEYQRAVSAFKLSRTRSLPDSAATAINNYMASREELHQPYFTSVTHNDDCDEPSSGFLAKSSIILILACALIQMMF